MTRFGVGAAVAMIALGLGPPPGGGTARAGSRVRADAPPSMLTLLLVLDRSGSMSGAPMEATRKACIYALTRLRRTDRIGIVAFDSRADTLLAPRPLGTGTEALLAIGKVQPGGGTDFRAPLGLVSALLLPRAGKVRDRHHVIFLSDGQSPQAGVLDRIRALQRAGITLSTVVLGAGADRQFLGRMASVGAGRTWVVNDPASLVPVVAGELRAVGR